MRLINCETLELHQFVDEHAPEYVTLSHVWRDGEVNHVEMLAPVHEVKRKLGYQKIVDCVRVCTTYRWNWLWVDTCCIDKSSSAELSEAINSMYTWYNSCIICYVYLDDFQFSKDSLFGTDTSSFDRAAFEQFRQCRWFTRGWTLQELLAPSEVCFFNSSWDILGYKSDIAMARLLSEITTIPVFVLTADNWKSSERSIAQRMSWASQRQTTRREDIAYCLLGMFDVNMPLLYGEGDRAFLRLQEEIIKRSDDTSIFAWRDPDGDDNSYRGLLASHPSEFSTCGNVFSSVDASKETESMPYAMTNRGLEMHTILHKLIRQTSQNLGVVQDGGDEETGLYMLPLDCSRFYAEHNHHVPILVMLKRLHPTQHQFARAQTYRLIESFVDNVSDIETVYVRHDLRPSILWTNVGIYGIQLQFLAQSSKQNFDRTYRHYDRWRVKYPGPTDSDVYILQQSMKLGRLSLTLPVTVFSPSPMFSHQSQQEFPIWLFIRSDPGDSHPKVYFRQREEEETERPNSFIMEDQSGDQTWGTDLSFEFYKTILIKHRFVLQVGVFLNRKW
jgi:hypothetical protein